MSIASVMLRWAFKRGDDKRDAGLTTPEEIRRFDDLRYGKDPKWNVLDVYRPKEAEGKLPVIVSVHGGGWVYGDKERYQYYCMSLARQGFAVVNFTYRLAPKYKFPAQLEDTNAVFCWLMDNAGTYGLDTTRIFGVGDSAGAHLLGLYSCICTNPAYAARFAFSPPEGFAPKALALNCGVYDVKLGGSYLNVHSLVNKSSGSTPLTVSTLGSDEDKAMKDINIGVRVADGVYTGGIQSASGAVVQDLWTERGLLYMKGDTNLHVSKVVVKEKLHVANDIISVGVFGVPPYHDGARMIYWNDAEAKNPSGRLARWYDRSYSDPEWMYLDLFGNGDVGSRYGVLMDAHWYRNIYGDSVSMVDTMRIRTEPIPMGDKITYFDRNNLIEIDDSGLYSDADPDEITAE